MKLLVTTALCAIASGLTGGIASQMFLSPPVAHAQTVRAFPPTSPETSAPRELITERFVMVDAKGHVRGELKLEKGNPEIVLYDSDGEVIWKAPMGPHVVY